MPVCSLLCVNWILCWFFSCRTIRRGFHDDLTTSTASPNGHKMAIFACTGPAPFYLISRPKAA